MNSPLSEPGAVSAPLGTDFDARYHEELGAIAWLFEELREGRALPVAEAKAIACSIHLTSQSAGGLRLTPLREMREYPAVHALNVALLAIGLAQQAGYEESDVAEIALAALLHDVGMVRVPLELIAKSEQLEPDERELIKIHPAEGARIIVEADAQLALPAVVAYEHHMRMDGSGYPAVRYPRQPHAISRLVQVCDLYHALKSPRPFREGWPDDVIFSFLQQRAGSEVDPDMATRLIAFIAMS